MRDADLTTKRTLHHHALAEQKRIKAALAALDNPEPEEGDMSIEIPADLLARFGAAGHTLRVNGGTVQAHRDGRVVGKVWRLGHSGGTWKANVPKRLNGSVYSLRDGLVAIADALGLPKEVASRG
jgi:hypothetical protein